MSVFQLPKLVVSILALLMIFTELPCSILIPLVLQWLPSSAALPLAAAGRFVDVPVEQFMRHFAVAVQFIHKQLQPILQHGLNVPVFEHRRLPGLLLAPSNSSGGNVQLQLHVLSASRLDLPAQDQDAFTHFMRQARAPACVSFVSPYYFPFALACPCSTLI